MCSVPRWQRLCRVFRTVAARLLNGDARFHDWARSVHHCRETQRNTQPTAQPNATNACTPQRGGIATAHNLSAQCIEHSGQLAPGRDAQGWPTQHANRTYSEES